MEVSHDGPVGHGALDVTGWTLWIDKADSNRRFTGIGGQDGFDGQGVMMKLTRMVVSMVEYSLRICSCLG